MSVGLGTALPASGVRSCQSAPAVSAPARGGDDTPPAHAPVGARSPQRGWIGERAARRNG